MINIQEIKPEQLNEPKIFDEINELVKEYSFGSYISEAFDFLQILKELISDNTDLKQINSNLFDKYQKIILQLSYISLPFLTEKEIYELIKKNLLPVFSFDINLRSKIELYLLLRRDDFQKNSIREAIARALIENEERIGSQKIKDTQGNDEEPFIKNWIRDYVQTYKVDKTLGNLEIVTYLNQSPNIKKINTEETKLLREVLKLYNYLRFANPEERGTPEQEGPDRQPPPTPSDSEGKLKIPAQGIRPKLLTKEPEKPVSYNKLQESFNRYKVQIPVFQGLENRILEKTKGQLLSIKEELVSALKSANKNQGIACLRILAEQKALINILLNSPPWQKTIIDYIQNKYKEQFSQIELNQLIINFSKLANTPAVLSEFLQYLLKERLRLTESESALVGVDLADILIKKGEKKFATLVTGNAETGEFEWVKNRIENGELVSEVS